MGITRLLPLMAGSAVRVYLDPPAAAVTWRVLRRPDDNFSAGANDPDATLIADGSTSTVMVDVDGLLNGQSYGYQVFGTSDGGETYTTDADPMTVVPAASYQDTSPDPQSLLLQRIAAAMAVETAAGTFGPGVAVQVVQAPFANPDKIAFPVVSVHVDDASPSDRFVGEAFAPNGEDPIAQDWVEGVGWMSSYRLNVSGVCKNPDQRIMLRRALRRAVLVNLEILAAAGIVEPSFSQQDTEMLPSSEGAVPLYVTAGSFMCRAPATVQSTSDLATFSDAIDLTVTTLPYEESLTNG